MKNKQIGIQWLKESLDNYCRRDDFYKNILPETSFGSLDIIHGLKAEIVADKDLVITILSSRPGFLIGKKGVVWNDLLKWIELDIPKEYNHYEFKQVLKEWKFINDVQEL